jgi:DUF2075 family protein
LDWLYRDPPDIRSSNQLEIAATESEMQGLELDYAAVCWGGDMIVDASAQNWEFREFVETQWESAEGVVAKNFIRNKYHLLLTRARGGLLLWVPPGYEADSTRSRDEFDLTAKFLQACGVPELE